MVVPLWRGVAAERTTPALALERHVRYGIREIAVTVRAAHGACLKRVRGAWLEVIHGYLTRRGDGDNVFPLTDCAVVANRCEVQLVSRSLLDLIDRRQQLCGVAVFHGGNNRLR